MTSTDLDQATREAVAALAFRLRSRDEADNEDRADVEPFALEFVMALRLRGWRPTPAQAPVAWPSPVGKGADPGSHSAELDQVRRDCAAATAKLRPPTDPDPEAA